jgi:hypothetical protein
LIPWRSSQRIISAPQTGFAKASYAPMIQREEERIQWQQDALVINNQIRAFSPQPAAYTSFKPAFKVFSSRLLNQNTGTVRENYAYPCVGNYGAMRRRNAGNQRGTTGRQEKGCPAMSLCGFQTCSGGCTGRIRLCCGRLMESRDCKDGK